MAKTYKHIFFDLDHTLWDFDANAQESISTLFSQLSLEEKLQVPFQDFYEKYLVHNKLLWSRYEKGFISVDELKWKRMWRTLLDFKIADEPLARKMSVEFLGILPMQKKVFPHTFEILDYLQKKNYILHLITNGFEKVQRNKLRSSGLDKYFEEVITSERSQSRKPEKEIFDFALLHSKATVEESLMLGDNLEADILGAVNYGMDSVYVNHIGGVVAEIKPTYEVTHLQQLERIL